MKQHLKSIVAGLGIFALAFALATPAPAIAQQQATPVNGDTRLVTFEFDPDQTYLILTRPRAVTHVQLRPDERVKGVFAGDTANFVIVVSADRNSILIRPKYPDQKTSMTLITTERSYPIMLRSNAEDGKWYQRVTWNFGDLVVEDLANAPPAELKPRPSRGELERSDVGETTSTAPRVAIDKLFLDYKVDGSADFKPTEVFDDGTRTFIVFPPGVQNFPAMFGIADGDARVLNFSVDGRYVIVQGTMPEILLKLGKSEVRIKRAGAAKGFSLFGDSKGG